MRMVIRDEGIRGGTAVRARNRGLLALVVAGMLVAASCAGDDSSGDSTEAGSGGTTATTAAPIESRFTGNDAYCTPAEGAPDEAPTAVDDGITADSITIGQARLQLEDLVDIGFSTDLGDQ